VVGDELSVEIFLPGHVTRTPARIVGCDIPHRLRLEFLWPTLHARDELDQALHAGRWHRVVTGRYEVVQSPLERLGLLHSPARERSARTIWEPVVVGGMWAPDEAVAFVRNADNDCPEIILFNDSQAVEIAMSRIPSLIGRRFRVVQGPLGVLLDEAALASKGGVRCKLEALESQISTGALASAAE
jgi:hypothetical protein